MIEKKILIFGLFVLFLLPASALAADGDSSPESTIVFSETLPDDIMFYPDNETHGSGYAESFADVSDWTLISGPASPTSDGDVGTFYIAGDMSWESIKTNSPSISDTTGYYAEIRYRRNSTGQCNFRIVFFSEDDFGGSYSEPFGTLGVTTAWVTVKVPLDGTGVESIQFKPRAYEETEIQGEYFRISNSTSMGWQHDGSTTAGVSNDAESGFTYSASSDNDVYCVNVSRDSGSGFAFVEIRLPLDTTTTYADIERDYYQFWEAKVRISRSSSAAPTTSYVTLFADGFSAQIATTITALSDWAMLRANLKASTVGAGATRYWRMGGYLDQTDEWICLEFDFVKLYSIANFTLTLNSNTINDYLYVDAGFLYSNIDSGYIELDHDPTLSVVPDTYPLYYNLSTIGIAPEFSMYVSSWSTYSDETRGIISSRIVTDIKLKFDSTEIISEIKFAMDDISIFDELFLSLDMWGYLGPMAMIVIGYVLAKKEKFLGVLWFAVECLFVTQYLALVEAMPDYWWHIFILLLGGLFTCVYPLLDR